MNLGSDMYSARILDFPKSKKNFKMHQNACFLKFQNMIIHIFDELFWHLLSKLRKNQVKLAKIDDFAQKN